MKQPARILVVDDEPNMRNSLADILRDEGYEVITAKDGYEAIEFCSKGQYDVVLMDVRMPGLDGVEAFRRIRRHHAGARVILMSAFGMEELKQVALQEGAIAFLDKPLHVETVISLIEQATETAILLVAVDKPMLEELQSTLKEHEYYVTVAQSSHDALELVEQIRFGVILIDVALPAMNGLDLYLAIRKLTPAAIAIMITGNDEEFIRIAEEAVSKTAYTFLQKPLDLDYLLDLLERIRGQTASDVLQKPESDDD